MERINKVTDKKTQKIKKISDAVPIVLVNACNVGRMPVSKKEKQLETEKKTIFLLFIFYMHAWGTHIMIIKFI